MTCNKTLLFANNETKYEYNYMNLPWGGSEKICLFWVFFSGFVSLWGGVTYRCLILTKNTWKHIFWKPCHPHNFHEANRQCCRELTGQNMLASWCLGFMSVFLTHVEQVGHTSVGCAGTCRAEVRWWQTSVPVCSWCGLRRWFRQRGRTDRWGWTPGRVGALGTHVHTSMAK